MPTKSYDNMSVKELRELQAKVSDALDKARVTRKRELKAKVKTMVEKEGFTLDELFGERKAGGRKTIGVPKYRNPEDPSQTWTGKGKRPNWMNVLLKKGRKKDEFLIK